MNEYLDWMTGGITLVGVYLTGRKSWVGQAIQFFSQFVWLVLIWRKELWGLLPLTIGLIVLYGKNTRAWYRSAHRNDI